MSNRDYKQFASGTVVHVYNRGNNRESIFHELCRFPYSRIRITDTHKGNFKLYAFCLMPNHFHLLIEQCGDIPISKIIAKVCTSYSRYINAKYKRVGHVFQDRFKAVLIESNEQLMWTSAYIHMNAVKDGLVKHPSDYKWSSYNDYVSDRNLPIIHTNFLILVFGDTNSFKKETLRFSSDENM